ncbi:MAG: hypothetical protein P8Z70_11090 [Desulfuromonadales bacterium]
MADEKTPKKEAKRVKVKVAMEGLTHKGKECKVGDIIEVTDWQAEWLKKSGRVEEAGKPASL